MKFVFFRFRTTEKMDSVMKELMEQCPLQNFWARTDPVRSQVRIAAASAATRLCTHWLVAVSSFRTGVVCLSVRVQLMFAAKPALTDVKGIAYTPHQHRSCMSINLHFRCRVILQ